MREGSLEAPVRHPIPWRDADYHDPGKLDAELRRVFDICHGCRRCFNLCDSFPRLFDLIDATDNGQLDDVASADFKSVVDACTLCDMCFMVKCPYVPPHEFDLDFPHLMLRYRSLEASQGKVGLAERKMADTDGNAALACKLAPLVNWATERHNRLTRPLMETLTGVHRDAALPRFHGRTFVSRAASEPPEVDTRAPAHGRKAVIYATCFVNYNDPEVGMAARAVLARNGVETEVVHPGCCGMPHLEHGDIAAVAKAAGKVAVTMKAWLDKGYDVISLVPSCSLMVKFEWPLILPEDDDVRRLARATFDVSEYVVDIAAKEGLAEGLHPLAGGVTVHIPCHARAQNMGRKANEMLKLLPDTEVHEIERCSGHGGLWGTRKDNFEVALKVGRPVARKAAENKSAFVVSECPLAHLHILQGIERQDGGQPPPEDARHPIQVMARAYGL